MYKIQTLKMHILSSGLVSVHLVIIIFNISDTFIHINKSMCFATLTELADL